MSDNDKRVWIIYTEVMGPDLGNGACVECFIATDDVADAIKQARGAIEENGFGLVDITRCIIYEEEDWTDTSDPDREVRDAVDDVLKDGFVQFGVFRSWE